MVYSDELGYDPDEWEECPPSEHFLVFSPFTRLALSLGAIAFTVFFFWLIDNHKNRGGVKSEEEEGVKVQRVQGEEAVPSASNDYVKIFTSLFTGARPGDGDFVQQSFNAVQKHEFKSPFERAQASKTLAEPPEPQFHYKSENEPKTMADVRTELDQASYELRDLLASSTQAPPLSSTQVPPPIPPHASPTTAHKPLATPTSAGDVYDSSRNEAFIFDSLASAWDSKAPEALGARPEPQLVKDVKNEGVVDDSGRNESFIFDSLMGAWDSKKPESQVPREEVDDSTRNESFIFDGLTRAWDEKAPESLGGHPGPSGFTDNLTTSKDDIVPRSLEDQYKKVQQGLTELVSEPLGVIIPGAEPRRTEPGQWSEPVTASSPIDEHVRKLTEGLLGTDQDQSTAPSEPSLHDVYEQRQRQLSPPKGSPVKMPTPQEAAELHRWEAELARIEAEKVAKLDDIIAGGDDSSDVAGSDGTDHLLPADHISMYSQDSMTHPELRRFEDTRGHPESSASEKINDKIEQISSSLEKSLLDEIEQLAKQTTTMQAELTRARESEYSTDEFSYVEPRVDAFEPAGDVRFIPEEEAALARIGATRQSDRESRDSDEYVKITPPTHSEQPSPSPAVLSSNEEEQLDRLVREYDLVDNGSSTTKKVEGDVTAPEAYNLTHPPLSPLKIPGQQATSVVVSPTTQELLDGFEQVSMPQSPLESQPQSPGTISLDSTEVDNHRAMMALDQQKRTIPEDEKAKLDEVLREFDMGLPSPGQVRDEQQKKKVTLDAFGRPYPTTPPHTPENLLDPFGRPISGQTPPSGIQGVHGQPTEMNQDYVIAVGSPTTEMTFPLAPPESLPELRKQFPGLPKRASIDIVDPTSLPQLPKDCVLPSDLEDVLQSLTKVDVTAPFLPSEPESDRNKQVPQGSEPVQVQKTVQFQTAPEPKSDSQAGPSIQPFMQPTSFVFTSASVEEQPAGPLGGQQPPQQPGQGQDFAHLYETPILTAPSPLPDSEADKPVKQTSIDLSHPLQPALSTFDRPTEGVKIAPAVEEEAEAYFTVAPKMMPAFGEKNVEFTMSRPAGAAGTMHPDELKNMAEADIFLQDAIDYMAAHKQKEGAPEPQQHIPAPTGFIMEEDMLSSQGEGLIRPKTDKSGEATSKLIKTNEVFERVDTHDEHDDMTYAPEIQSVEIPPDQMSETSEIPADLPLDEPLGRSVEAQRLEAEIRAQEQAMEDAAAAKAAIQHKAAIAQAPHIISVNSKHPRFPSTPSISSTGTGNSPKALRKQSSLLSILGVTSTQEMLLKIDSLEALSGAMRKAGLESTNVIFGIDYTASNKYQGEESFGGHSLHTIHPNLKNPYQQVITILGRTLAPFTSTGCIPVFGFGDARTSDWSVFPLKANGVCTSLEEVLKTYNEVTPTVELSGPTNFSPLIYQAIEICQTTKEYHILVIIADGQVTNEKATRRAIVQACQYPLSIIVVGVGDGPWEMMRVFDESLPKRPWDNFHFVEFHEVVKKAKGAVDGDVKVAIQSLLEIPDQYRCIINHGLLKGRSPSLSQHK